MDDSLLVNLRSYRPRTDRDSLENFVTEVFAWLLRRSENLSASFLEVVRKGLDEAARFSLPEAGVTWETQFSLGSKRPDMAASWAGMLLLFEHKVGAGLGAGQLTEYRRLASEYFPEGAYRLILVTANTAQHSDKADLCLCWSQIHELAERARDDAAEETERGHIAEFIALLLHEGLSPPAPIGHQAIQYYPIAGKLPSQLEEVLASSHSADWPLKEDYVCEFKKLRWGRIGLEFKRPGPSLGWSPGLFLGCVLDGGDHRIAHRIESRLFLHLIVDFDPKLHGLYQDMRSYDVLKDELAATAAGSGWTFYDHLSDPDRQRGTNRYHPIYLEMPLLEVFRGTSSSEAQRDKFFAAGCEGLRLLQEAGLADLMAECDRAADNH